MYCIWTVAIIPFCIHLDTVICSLQLKRVHYSLLLVYSFTNKLSMLRKLWWQAGGVSERVSFTN